MSSLWIILLFIPLCSTFDYISVSPKDSSLTVNETVELTFSTSHNLVSHELVLFLNHSSRLFGPERVDLINGSGKVSIRALRVGSQALVEVIDCEDLTLNKTKCTADISDTFSRVNILRSHFVDVLVIIVGWTYFFAWSISFYPQIWLNYQRKSVVGLNFDFLFLNVIGFAAYTVYNVLNYWSPVVKAEYHTFHPKSPMPVLFNDVIFAIHALGACIFTVLQCSIYERENQRVHPLSLVFGGVLVVVGFFTATLSFLSLIPILQFVNSLSYIKMAVTLSKYFPQAIYNFQRKSTVGWSIGNVLLDFTGGSLDVMQMVLQAWNVGNWTAFIGNPVKFGLGLVSMLFDIVFITQHYCLYPESEHVPLPSSETDAIPNYENLDDPQSTTPEEFDDDSTAAQRPIVSSA